MQKFSVLAMLIVALAIITLAAGCGGSDAPGNPPPPPPVAQDQTLRLYSKYVDNGKDTMELSRVNGPYYTYLVQGQETTIIPAIEGNSTGLIISLTYPDDHTVIVKNATGIIFNQTGEYHFQIKNDADNGLIGEDVRLDIALEYQKPQIEAYVETIKGYKTTTGKNVTQAICTLVNNGANACEVGVSITTFEASIDFEIASAATTFAGNRGSIEAGQHYLPGYTDIWRSSNPDNYIRIGDEINTSQYFLTVTPGEETKLLVNFIDR